MALPTLPAQIENMGDLKKAVSLWANRDDPEFLDSIPNFINFAEKDIYRRLRIPSLEREIYLNVQNGLAHIPVDLVEFKYIMDVDQANMCRATSLEEVQWLKNNRVIDLSEIARDEFCYARANNRLFFAPTITAPSDGLTYGRFLMGYISDSPELKTDTDTCNILTIAPDLVLYMALKHSCLFVQDDEGAQKWGTLAESAMALIQEQANKAEYSGSPLVIPNTVKENTGTRTMLRFGVIR